MGTVRDPNGAAVIAAVVRVRNENTNATRIVESTDTGNYVVPLLPPGRYEVIVEANGFRRVVLSEIELNVDETVRVDVTLQLGILTQDVVVTSSPPLLQTDTSSLGHVVDRQKVSNLPLNERNFLDFTLLVPGAQLPAEGSQNSTQGGAISVNGAREQSNNFLLDGVDNNYLLLNQFTVLPSVDAIEEFKVQSSNSSAEFGRSAGAQINVVLKSGTNDFHGTLFEFVRNRHLDAKNFFDRPNCRSTSPPGTCSEIPRFDRSQFGGTFGGPLRRDRTFFFVSYEGLRLRQAITRQAGVPSQLERAVALAAIPSFLRNPAGEAVLDLFPMANVGPDLTTSNTFVSAPVLRSSVNQFVVKLDHPAGERDTFSGHYARFDDDSFRPFDPFIGPLRGAGLPGFGIFDINRGQNAGFRWTHIFDPKLVNEFRVGFNRFGGRQRPENFGIDKSRELGFPTLLREPETWGFPRVVVAGFDTIGEPVAAPQETKPNTFQLADNLAWMPDFHSGRHHFMFGFDIRRVQSPGGSPWLARGEWDFLGVFTGNSLTDLLLGLPTFAIGPEGRNRSDARTFSLNFYAQDAIRVAPRLTLDLGLRYEYNDPVVDALNTISTPDLSASTLTCTPQPACQFIVGGTQGVPRATYGADTNNFAPRVGFGWRPLESKRFVVRGGYGIFYDITPFVVSYLLTVNPPFYTLSVHPNFALSSIQTILNQPGFAPFAFRVAPDFSDGYLQHWNLDIQYELLSDLLVDLAYVGSKGNSLTRQRDTNQINPQTGLRPFPQFNVIASVEPTASSNYNALQFRAEKRLSHGLTFLTAYTWSKSSDDSSALFPSRPGPSLAQDSSNLEAERGLSIFHTKHRFVLSYLYALPLGAGQRWLDAPGLAEWLLGGWKLGGIWTFQSGRPFTVNRGIDQSGSGTFAREATDRPDQITDPFQPGPVLNHPDPACHQTASQGGYAADVVRDPASWFNPCAFAPAPGRFGTAGRNTLIGPGLQNIDVSLLKEIRLSGESHRLQFRFEVFNLLNHPNFDLPDNNFDSLTFGQVQSAGAFAIKPSRQIQFGLKYIL